MESQSTTTGDWAETVRILNGFRASLHAAIDNEDAAAGLKTCMEIIAWGGDRSSARGAVPFLRELADQNTLLAYLAATRADLALSTAQLGAPLHVKKMNSMLTKVHAMASEDGLPIYDSRVAAAIAALVEVWRRVQGTSASPLPALLTFPATSRERTVRDMAADAMLPGVMSYEPSYEARTARSWSEAKIRLGWLMQRILADAPGLFKGSMPERMHAFEASLFMIGYDVAASTLRLRNFLPRLAQRVCW
jgi:hypothetical protein